jgi:hypothetical protein
LATPRLVGTEIAHAVPLTLVAGLGHASMGNLDLELLGQLLIGSLPGIYIEVLVEKCLICSLEMLLQLCSFRRIRFGFRSKDHFIRYTQ